MQGSLGDQLWLKGPPAKIKVYLSIYLSRSAVVTLRKAGLSYSDIERLTGKGKKFVQYWVKRTEAAAVTTTQFQDARRCEMPCKVNKSAKNEITNLAKGKWGRGSRTVTKMLNAKKAKPLSRSTVLRYIKS